jgi:hypothetical protein
MYQSLQALSARVDIIPLFLDRPVDLHLDDGDIETSPSPSVHKKRGRRNGAAVRVQHVPSGVTAESSGTEQTLLTQMWTGMLLWSWLEFNEASYQQVREATLQTS